jgi:hypothetical protein
MRLHRVLWGVFTIAATMAVAAADLPYAGRWKMNPAKSDFGETTVTYEILPSGDMQATTAGQTYKFKMDGRDYPAWFGFNAGWKPVSPTSWQTIWKLKGKVVTTDTLTLSADGKTLTVNTRGPKPDGGTIDDTIVSERVAGGPGLAGKWKTKNMKSASPNVLEFATSGADGLAFKIVDMGLLCNAKLDGKDHPCAGPTLASGWTVAFANQGARALDMTVKNSGKVVFKMSYTVSADGRTLTENTIATGSNEKTKVVYDRQ